MPDPNKPKAPLPDGRGGGRGGPNAGGRFGANAGGRGGPGGGGRGGGGSGGGGRSAKDIGRAAIQQYSRDKPGGGSMHQSEKQIWTDFIHTLRDRSLLPAIMFMFSKKNIDTTASTLTNIDLTTAEEKSHIRGFIDRYGSIVLQSIVIQCFLFQN